MGQIRTRSSEIKKRLQRKREERKKERSDADHTPKDPERGKSDQLAKRTREVTDDGIDITDWPTRAQAARRAGISRSTLIRLQQSDDIQAVQDSDGNWRFNPDDLDVIAEGRTNEAAAIMTETIGTVVKVSQEQTASAQDHAAKFAELTMEHSEMAWESMRLMTKEIVEENVSLRAYVRELEAERKENIKEIDRAQTKAHEREIDREKEKRLDDRIDWALSTVAAIAGPMVISKLGLTGGNIPTSPAGTIGALLKAKEEAPKTVSNGEITIEKLEELNMNALLLIANIDEQRFKMLCLVATAEEVKALTEVRETVARIRANKEKKPDGESSKTEGS